MMAALVGPDAQHPAAQDSRDRTRRRSCRCSRLGCGERRGSALRLVNAAYTAQVVPWTNFVGDRRGDRLYCTRCGVVWHADHAAAINVLLKVGDPGIALFTPHMRVRQTLRENDRQRSRLPDQDFSATPLCVCAEGEPIHQ
ncbi:zinc ribbon domain-containing protein [Saccharopolyspora hattusasensis]|uniref:zinc ribbon domain-containing protein n=1 Tax=Saccharopolyspora hattusasensis TaxID=1128679 RepID=UPI003D99EB15